MEFRVNMRVKKSMFGMQNCKMKLIDKCAK